MFRLLLNYVRLLIKINHEFLTNTITDPYKIKYSSTKTNNNIYAFQYNFESSVCR